MPKPREVKRKFRNRLLILCEGTETEPRYFKGIQSDRSRSNHLTLDIHVYDTKINTGKELVQLATILSEQAEKEDNEYDGGVWIVIDKDGYTKHPETFNRASALGFHIAFSSISFEYWFLLHFEMTTKAFAKADQLIKHLETKGYKDYEKHLDHYATLKDKTKDAVKNAEAARKSLKDSFPDRVYERNPYTDVDTLVKYLLGI